MNTPKANYRGTILLICMVAALGGLLFGLDMGFIASSLKTIHAHYHIDVLAGQHYAAVLAWGGILGALLSGPVVRIIGRKKTLIFAGSIFTIMSALSTTLPTLAILTQARFFLGVAIGIASFAVPLYLSEIAPPQIRGRMTSLYQLMLTIGIFMIAVTNVAIASWVSNDSTALSLMFYVIVLFAVLMLLGCLFIPESPRWLILAGKEQEAKRVLKQIFSDPTEIEEELGDIHKSIDQNKGWGFDMLLHGFFWKVLIIGVVLQMFQQLVGINLMIYYAPTFFQHARMTGVLAVLIIPFANMIFTFPTLRWIEKWGRKNLLIFGSTVMMIAMFCASVSFYLIHHKIGTRGLEHGFLLISCIAYIFGFACSWGPVVWVVCAEIFPLKGREIGLTVTTMVNWLFAGVVMANSLSFMHTYGDASIFLAFSMIAAISIVFVQLFIPETKGASLEQIELNLERGVRLTDIGKLAIH